MSAPESTEVRRERRKNALLLPAVALMNRLTYPRKFFLISVLFLGLLTLIAYFLLQQLDESIDFTAKEKVGTRYLRPLVQVFRDAGEARRLAKAWARGERTIRPKLERELAEVDEGIQAVGAVDRELGPILNASSKFNALKNNWAHLRKDAFDPALDHADKLFEDFLGEIQRLYSYVGDESNLILDPDLDTYYLMDSILLKLHEGQDRLMKAAQESEDIAFRKTLTPEERAGYTVRLGLIRSNLEETRKNAEKAFLEKNNPSHTLRPRLQQHYDDYVLAVRAYLDGLDRDIVQPRTLTVASDAITQASIRPVDLGFLLWTRATNELDELMDARIAKYEWRKKVAWVSALVVLALVGYLWLGFYAAVMGTVDDLEHASQRMLGADVAQEVVLETHDELGRVTRSFNAIAQRLRREWEQATQDNARARAAEAGLLESEERTRLIIQSALDAVITMDVEGKVAEWNPQAAAMFGWTRQETIGKKLSELIIPEQHRSSHEAGLRRFRETGEGPVLNKRIEITALRRGGAEFPVEISITPLSQGKGAAFSAFVRDITERKRNEEELRKAKDAAESSNRTKSEFLANMSHELRTPLNSIIGFSSVILRGKGKTLAPQEATYLERILDNGKHLLGLINTILDLSKIEAGKVDLNIVEVALDVLIRDTLAQLEGRVVDKKIRLAADLPPRVAPFPTDPDKLRQILINLVGNAIKFTEQGSVTVRLVVDPKTEVPRRIDIVDTGVGIPKDMLGKIFDAFQQVDTGMARKYEGTGLGLTISRSLSHLLGCRIEVDSEPGKGSTFSLHLLPVAPERASNTTTRMLRTEPATEAMVRDADAELKDKLVLVIDDEDDSRFLLRQYVSDCGCRVSEASSGAEAIAKARVHKPDLITLDLMMPGMNGWETLRNLKADPDLFDVPVVVVSIVGSENRGTIFGAADLLNKPVAREELCAVLRRNVKHGGGKVLVVDDDANARQIVAEYLAEEKSEIRMAGNGQEALQALKSFTPDLIILDLMMPVMDGMTFLDIIRRDPATMNIPVVVATAKELTLQEVRQLETAVSVVLRKGDDLRLDLGRVVRNILIRSAAAAPAESRSRIPVKVRPILADMIPGFLDARRKEVVAIREALQKPEFEPIRVMGHNMKGIGSSYGFPPITEFGRRIEEAAIAKGSDEIRKQLEGLADYLARVDVVSE